MTALTAGLEHALDIAMKRDLSIGGQGYTR
jgi:hypothetical protein